MKLDVTIIDPNDVFEADAREFGEPSPGPWLRVTCDDPFCDYKCSVIGEDCASALGLKIMSLVAEALRPLPPTGTATVGGEDGG